ncbi:hypothetical protein GTW78_14680 [Streptomyces sp. SID4948]|nr:hypothetical protein [Streptomyces sp. SID4948]
MSLFDAADAGTSRAVDAAKAAQDHADVLARGVKAAEDARLARPDVDAAVKTVGQARGAEHQAFAHAVSARAKADTAQEASEAAAKASADAKKTADADADDARVKLFEAADEGTPEALDAARTAQSRAQVSAAKAKAARAAAKAAEAAADTAKAEAKTAQAEAWKASGDVRDARATLSDSVATVEKAEALHADALAQAVRKADDGPGAGGPRDGAGTRPSRGDIAKKYADIFKARQDTAAKASADAAKTARAAEENARVSLFDAAGDGTPRAVAAAKAAQDHADTLARGEKAAEDVRLGRPDVDSAVKTVGQARGAEPPAFRRAVAAQAKADTAQEASEAAAKASAEAKRPPTPTRTTPG